MRVLIILTNVIDSIWWRWHQLTDEMLVLDFRLVSIFSLFVQLVLHESKEFVD